MTAAVPRSSKQLLFHLIAIYAQASLAAVVVSLFLVLLGLEFTNRQWIVMLSALPISISLYVVPDFFLISRHYRPLGLVLHKLDLGEQPSRAETSQAIVRALNLPYLSFLRVILFHGPAAALSVWLTLVVGNYLASAGNEAWQILTFSTIVFFFASPTHAIFASRAPQRRRGRR